MGAEEQKVCFVGFSDISGMILIDKAACHMISYDRTVGILYRDFTRGTDDVTVVVARERSVFD